MNNNTAPSPAEASKRRPNGCLAFWRGLRAQTLEKRAASVAVASVRGYLQTVAAITLAQQEAA
jgi:hypothetical protein